MDRGLGSEGTQSPVSLSELCDSLTERHVAVIRAPIQRVCVHCCSGYPLLPAPRSSVVSCSAVSAMVMISF